MDLVDWKEKIERDEEQNVVATERRAARMKNRKVAGGGNV